MVVIVAMEKMEKTVDFSEEMEVTEEMVGSLTGQYHAWTVRSNKKLKIEVSSRS